ncbi:MAG: indole-3-glycerol-phosphate synthase [Candidatus Bathyarchaeia archaeon]
MRNLRSAHNRDYLDLLALRAHRTVREGYYQMEPEPSPHEEGRDRRSLVEAIRECRWRNPLIAEIKPYSPSKGRLRTRIDYSRLAASMERGGAVALSILTEPKVFRGSLRGLMEARLSTSLPILMKDVVVDPIQVEAASRLGADAILLIHALFRRGLARVGLRDMISLAHSKGLEVILEAHARDEIAEIKAVGPDLVGVNNRDLTTLKVDLETTKRLLEGYRGPPTVGESGVEDPSHVRLLMGWGVDAVLVGSSIMAARDVAGKVRELVEA